jgi:hypothetical protein
MTGKFFILTVMKVRLCHVHRPLNLTGHRNTSLHHRPPTTMSNRSHHILLPILPPSHPQHESPLSENNVSTYSVSSADNGAFVFFFGLFRGTDGCQQENVYCLFWLEIGWLHGEYRYTSVRHFYLGSTVNVYCFCLVCINLVYCLLGMLSWVWYGLCACASSFIACSCRYP